MSAAPLQDFKNIKRDFYPVQNACELGLNLEDIPEEFLHFLENYVIAHGSTIPMVLGAALPFTVSLGETGAHWDTGYCGTSHIL